MKMIEQQKFIYYMTELEQYSLYGKGTGYFADLYRNHFLSSLQFLEFVNNVNSDFDQIESK